MEPMPDYGRFEQKQEPMFDPGMKQVKQVKQAKKTKQRKPRNRRNKVVRGMTAAATHAATRGFQAARPWAEMAARSAADIAGQGIASGFNRAFPPAYIDDLDGVYDANVNVGELRKGLQLPPNVEIDQWMGLVSDIHSQLLVVIQQLLSHPKANWRISSVGPVTLKHFTDIHDATKFQTFISKNLPWPMIQRLHGEMSNHTKQLNVMLRLSKQLAGRNVDQKNITKHLLSKWIEEWKEKHKEQQEKIIKKRFKDLSIQLKGEGFDHGLISKFMVNPLKRQSSRSGPISKRPRGGKTKKKKQ